MPDQVRLNVRCCCQPTKILGTMEVSSRAFECKRILIAPPLPLVSQSARSSEAQEVPTPAEVSIRRIELGGGNREWAIYTEDRGIEFWRRIPSFREGDQV